MTVWIVSTQCARPQYELGHYIYVLDNTKCALMTTTAQQYAYLNCPHDDLPNMNG